MERVRLAVLVALLSAGGVTAPRASPASAGTDTAERSRISLGARAQEAPPAPRENGPDESPPAPGPGTEQPPPSAAAPEEPSAALPPAPGAPDMERTVGPTPGAPTVSLAAAVSLALERNFALLDSADSVSASVFQEQAARAEFFPQLVPVFLRGGGRTLFGLDLQQELPWTGGSLTASGRYLSAPDADSPFPRSTDLRLVLSQPLLRGFGPNATFFDLTNARRARVGQERGLELARQRIAIQVATAFYNVVAQRQLLDVAEQSLERTEGLQKASAARLEVGMASKLDVFRAELQAAQARDSMVRSEASLENALEQFRGLLALPPDDPVEPEEAVLPRPREGGIEPVEILVQRALQNRLELQETRDRVGDAERAYSLARQNLLPQLDANVTVTQLGYGGSFGDAWAAGDRRVEFFLSASYPLQRAAEKASRAVAELDVGSRQRAVRQGEIDVEQEVRAAARELERIRKSVELQEQAVAVAVQQRRLAVLRYQRGLGSNFDVVDAESSLVLARSALVGLLASYAVARLELERATGTLDVLAEFAP